MKKEINVFCDGSYYNNKKLNKKFCSYAVVFPKNKNLNESVDITDIERKKSNNVAELLAIYLSLELCINNYHIDDNVTINIYTDSMLCINTFDSYCFNWKRFNWKKYDGKEIQNLSLIIPIYELICGIRKMCDLNFIHVKSHQKKPNKNKKYEYYTWKYNKKVDELAKNSWKNKLIQTQT